jgi:hypothetical protein
MTGIGEAVKASKRKKYWKQIKNTPSTIQPPVMPPKPSVRYQNKGKQMMYEVYLKDLRENPQWAAFKVKHNNYGGYVFDDTEN